MISPEETKVKKLGECKFESPLASAVKVGKGRGRLISDDERIRYRVEINETNQDEESVTFEKAGPREKIFFNPSKTTVGIVTCGGLCPGLNNVIRSLTLELYENYGVRNILGFRYGYLGFLPEPPAKPIQLTPDVVRDIAEIGGTILGSSRGPVEPEIIVDTLVRYGVDILFTLGGDGTQRGAEKLVEEIEKRKVPISVIGVPKTIDNDVSFVYQTFGFATAVDQARCIIRNAATEVSSFLDSIAIVKLMGRDAGFISAWATLSSQEVDFCLIPEVSFGLEGENGFLSLVERKVKTKGSAVIVVSEGAGQEFFNGLDNKFDASGNRLQHDIGLFLREKLEQRFSQAGIKANFRYFDPSYSIRSVRANAADSYYCDQLARAAAHAGMSGNTSMIVGYWYNNLTHVPVSLVTAHKKQINPEQELWRDVLAVTGQPVKIG